LVFDEAALLHQVAQDVWENGVFLGSACLFGKLDILRAIEIIVV
jgi:hypothetical protein